jgi:hypothetical protein
MGCGGGSGLFATVPPPVEFVPTLIPGLVEVPAAGTYSGTLTKERVTFDYTPGVNGAQSTWNVESAVPLGAPTAAQAIVVSDGTVRLKETSSTRNLFVGNFEVLDKPSIYGATVANLVGADGAKGTYPYLLQEGTPRRLTLMPRANIQTLSSTRIRYDRYTFVVTPD